MTAAEPETALPRSGLRVLAGLLAGTVLLLLTTELTQEKRLLLAAPASYGGAAPPASSGAPARAAQPDARPSAPSRRAPRPSPPVPSPALPTPVEPPEQPPATVPVLAGTYRYAYSVDGGEPETALLSVRRLDAAHAIRDEQTWSGADDQASTLEEDWTPSSVRTTRTGDCSWSPPDTSLVLPLHKGSRWTSRTSCRNDDGSTTHEDTVSTVKGWTKVMVGGVRVATWVVERSTRTTGTAGRVTAHAFGAVTDFFAPALGLIVVQSVRTSYPDADGREQTVTAVRRLVDTRRE